MLSMFGYQPETFASAKEFLGSAAINRAACLVIDVELGDMSGLELAERLTLAGSRVPVILMTGSPDAGFRSEALRLGCFAYLYKPFCSALLIEAIEKAVGRPRTKADGPFVDRFYWTKVLRNAAEDRLRTLAE